MKVLVVGLARSGVAACEVLRDLGSVVKATDIRSGEDIGPGIEKLKDLGVALELGRHSTEFAGDCDLVVVSPGVPLESDIIRWAYEHGRTVMSEVELAYCLSEARFVAVTGTNGKSTTVSLLGHVLSAASDKVRVGGNIGYPISSIASGLDRDWVCVVEVSSFQLDTCISFRPAVSVLLNITPDHLDRYQSYDAYVESKARLFANQTKDDIAIINRDNKECLRAARDTKCRKLFFSVWDELDEGAFVRDERVVVRVGGDESEVFLTKHLRIRGPHNLANSLAAALAATTLDVEPETIRRAIQDFEGLEHRMEFVARIGGVEFINDSKATNLDSLRCALEAATSPTVLIAGGRDKGSDWTELSPLIRERVKSIVAIGEARHKIRDALSGASHVQFAETLENAVRGSFGLADSGEMVLLSPGCASFDMFNDFEHRGIVFKRAVMKLKEEHGAE
jgi:UDP-N-acetylmuramoylalanine--D-glutamate ligase